MGNADSASTTDLNCVTVADAVPGVRVDECLNALQCQIILHPRYVVKILAGGISEGGSPEGSVRDEPRLISVLCDAIWISEFR